MVFAALAVSHDIETQNAWSIKRFVRTTLCEAVGKINEDHAH